MSLKSAIKPAIFAALGALGLAFTGAARADVMYHISISTPSPLMGTTGTLAIQFNPSPGAQDALATLTNFVPQGGALLVPPPSNSGGASGDLATTLTIQNLPVPPNNEEDYTINYGTGFSFDLTLSGAAVNNPDPNATGSTTFSVFLLDSMGNTPLATNMDGSSLDITIEAGNPNPIVTTSDTGAPPVATVTVTATSVPEPSSVLLLGLGIGAAVGYARRKTFPGAPTPGD